MPSLSAGTTHTLSLRRRLSRIVGDSGWTCRPSWVTGTTSRFRNLWQRAGGVFVVFVWIWCPAWCLQQVNLLLRRVSMFLHKYDTWLGRVTSKMMVPFYARNFLKVWHKEVGPIVGGHNRLPILVTHKLREVTVSRVVHDLSDGFQAPNFGASVQPLEQPEAPVWCKLGVTDYKKRECDGANRLVSALHARYCIMQLFLFCPVQLSAWRNTTFSPNPCDSKK